MTTDKDLLFMSLVALGKSPTDYVYFEHNDYHYMFNPMTNVEFSPLSNNGDAFSLQVALGMEVYVDNHPDGCECVEVESHTHKVGRVVLTFAESSTTEDQEKATRRAITMIAAKVGLEELA